jgi:hypothetical protein
LPFFNAETYDIGARLAFWSPFVWPIVLPRQPVLRLGVVTVQDLSGTDVMIFLIFSAKNLAKIWAFFAQTTASFCKNFDRDIGF